MAVFMSRQTLNHQAPRNSERPPLPDGRGSDRYLRLPGPFLRPMSNKQTLRLTCAQIKKGPTDNQKRARCPNSPRISPALNAAPSNLAGWANAPPAANGTPLKNSAYRRPPPTTNTVRRSHQPTPPLVQRLTDVRTDDTRRYPSGLDEFDRVLGGGIVPGSAVLVGGDPGIGKSTLLLQAGHALAASKRKTVYVTSEESLGQVRLRAARLNIEDSPMRVAAQTNLDIIINLLQQEKPDVVIIDSIQMIYRPDLSAAPGSVTQLRDAAARLIWLAKQMNFALLLVGHVTKEGAIAGPKLLEHLVDCVAYFEGDRFHSHRLVRTIKNRFGSTDEIGIFEMTDGGLAPVPDPSKMFLAEQREARPGSVVLAANEGTRTLLVEVQALCVQSVFGSAKRKTTGVDAGRTAMVLAVLEKHAECVVGDQDVFVNVVGGVRVTEPAADLAIALAVYSDHDESLAGDRHRCLRRTGAGRGGASGASCQPSCRRGRPRGFHALPDARKSARMPRETGAAARASRSRGASASAEALAHLT